MSSRGPLVARPPPHQSPSTHGRIVRSQGSLTKRPRSPEAAADARTKRARASNTPAAPDPPPRDERRADREAYKDEFRQKYRKGFPHWVFHFDADIPPGATLDRVQSDIEYLGGRVDDFFSAEVTHLITNAPVPTPTPSASAENKENTSKSRPSHVKSPHNVKLKLAEEEPYHKPTTVLSKAQEFGLKIWSVAKLDSVLERTLLPEERDDISRAPRTRAANPSLTALLAAERMHGTSERDPTQRRHDFRYFSKPSYFVLIEDIRQELATIGVVEYPVTREADGGELGAWPVLHAHPHARGPFIAYDEREHRRWERQEQLYAAREAERAKAKARYLASVRRKQARLQAERDGAGAGGDLRRTVSLSSLRRADSLADVTAADGDTTAAFESAHASGYLASGPYVAASGNSVSVASTTGTTSAAGSFTGRTLPAGLRGKLQHEVLTSRKAGKHAADDAAPARNESMGPPAAVPDRRVTLLRKSRSTNSLRLPKRQEGTKPGFCESCRVKFDDFTYHVKSRKHRKFATEPSNFLQLDTVLARVRRPTLAEVAAERAGWETGRAPHHDDYDRTHEDALYDEDAVGEDEIDLDA